MFLSYLTIFCTSLPLGVLGTISRMAKTCALRMTPTKIYFILADNATVGGVSIWCELTQVCLKFPGIVNQMFRNQTQLNSIHGLSLIESQFDWVLLTMSGFFQNTVWHIHDRVQFLIIFLVSLNLVVRPDMGIKSGWFYYFVVNNYKIFERHSFYKRYLSRNQSADIPLTP